MRRNGLGGLVGTGSGTITTSYFDKTTSGKTYGVGSNTSATGVTGLTTATMQAYSSFSNTWSIASSGGSSSTWRIYDGYTYPLLRTFLTSLATDKTTTYTGAVQYGIGYGLSNITGTLHDFGQVAGPAKSSVSGLTFKDINVTLKNSEVVIKNVKDLKLSNHINELTYSS